MLLRLLMHNMRLPGDGNFEVGPRKVGYASENFRIDDSYSFQNFQHEFKDEFLTLNQSCYSRDDSKNVLLFGSLIV